MLGVDVLFAFEVGYGSGDFADFVVCAGAECEFGHRLFEELHAEFVECAVFFELLVCHAGVGHDPAVAEALGLDFAGGDDLIANDRRIALTRFGAQLVERYGFFLTKSTVF